MQSHIKLSEALLLGIPAVKENRNTFLSEDNPQCPEGCALGTAVYAVGVRAKDMRYRGFSVNNANPVKVYDKIIELWPWVTMKRAKEISVRHTYGESRESIAAWIATIEPQDVPTPTTQEVSNESICTHSA